jgi:hypothetical protein
VIGNSLAVTSQDFIKFWGNFFASYFVMLIENSQELKTFECFKSFIRKLIQAFYYFLKNFFEKDQVSKILFSSLFQNLCKLISIGSVYQKTFKKRFHFQNQVESYFQTLYQKVLSLNSKKNYFQNPNSIFAFMQASPFCYVHKV